MLIHPLHLFTSNHLIRPAIGSISTTPKIIRNIQEKDGITDPADLVSIGPFRKNWDALTHIEQSLSDSRLIPRITLQPHAGSTGRI